MKQRLLLILSILAIWVGISFMFPFPAVNAYELTFTKASSTWGNGACGDHECQTNENPHWWLKYLQSEFNHRQTFQISQTPVSLDIFMPDGTCNIQGVLNPDGTCSYPTMIISAVDFQTLKGNPAIMAVTNIQAIQGKPSVDYCTLTNWIVISEDGYWNSVSKFADLINPPYCHGPHPVPEYGQTVAIVLASVITIGVILSARSGLKVK